MKIREINETPRWTVWVPDSIADWDAPSHWERARCRSMEERLKPGTVLYDVGTEHGWLSALYATWCGAENMVLIEPSPEFWVNIRKTWVANGFPEPKWCWSGFISDVDELENADLTGNWPESADLEAPECPGMAYRYLFGPHPIPKMTIDTLVEVSGVIPDAITIDIEGAELLALTGATQTLMHHRPTVWVSVHPDLMERDFGHLPGPLKALMTSYGYSSELLEIDHEEHWLFLPKELK